MWEGEPGVVGRDILACSGLPYWGRNRQEWKQLVSRGGDGVGPSIGFLAPPPATDRSVQEELCVCAFAGQHPPWLPPFSPVGTVAPLVPLL